MFHYTNGMFSSEDVYMDERLLSDILLLKMLYVPEELLARGLLRLC